MHYTVNTALDPCIVARRKGHIAEPMPFTERLIDQRFSYDGVKFLDSHSAAGAEGSRCIAEDVQMGR